jgi:tRNA 2-thiouridine synthesizing protein A
MGQGVCEAQLLADGIACCRSPMSVDDAGRLRHLVTMTTTKLDLTGLKCPLPALKTRKALKSIKPGDVLEVICTDPLSVIDIPNLIRETGDSVEITERAERRIVFMIEKAKQAA